MSKYNIGICLSIVCLLAACSDSPVGVSPDSISGREDASAVALSKRAGGVSVAKSSGDVVMSGLHNPRGIAFGPEGALYVAEAGSPEVNGPCVDGPRGQSCYSGTGSISRFWRGQHTRMVTGLPSLVKPGSGEIEGGPQDIAFQGRGNGFVTIGLGGDPAIRSEFGAHGHHLGTLIAVNPSGNWRMVADIAAFEETVNPAGGRPDSNPYGVLAEPGRQFVADAGGNALVEVSASGQVSLVAVFDPIPVPPGPFNPPFAQSEAVPTEVKRGPDGALYVSVLTGVPFHPGLASIYRVVPGQTPQVHVDGLTAITDFDFGPDGSLYVVGFASQPFLGGAGTLIHIAPDGARMTIADDLTTPTGVTVGPDGAVYVVNMGVIPGQGEVLRFVH